MKLQDIQIILLEVQRASITSDKAMWLDSTDSDGNTPLMQLALNGLEDSSDPKLLRQAVKELIAAGADVLVRNGNDLSAFELAFSEERTDVVKEIMHKIATLSVEKQNEAYQEFGMSESLLALCNACNQYLSVLVTQPRISGHDAQNIQVVRGALLDLVTGQGDEEERVTNLYDVIEAFRDDLTTGPHKKEAETLLNVINGVEVEKAVAEEEIEYANLKSVSISPPPSQQQQPTSYARSAAVYTPPSPPPPVVNVTKAGSLDFDGDADEDIIPIEEQGKVYIGLKTYSIYSSKTPSPTGSPTSQNSAVIQTTKEESDDEDSDKEETQSKGSQHS